MVPVLNTANIRDGELRRLSTWENNPDALALVDSVYHRIAGISRDDGLITLEDAEGNTRLISPREAVAEGVTLYTRTPSGWEPVTGCASRRVTGSAVMWPTASGR